MAERLPADVWAQILAAAGEEIFALSVSSQQMRRVLHRDALDAAWIQVIRRVSERPVARADRTVDVAADLGARFALREKLRGFFAARAGRPRDRVLEWLDAHAPRVVARGVHGVAVARDGTLAVLTAQSLELRRGGAVVGALPNDGLRGVQAAGSRFLVTRAHQSVLVVSAADASVLERVTGIYYPIGGDWVRVRTRSTQLFSQTPLRNLETGAALTAAQAGAASVLAFADDATLVTCPFWETGTLFVHDGRTGAFASLLANQVHVVTNPIVRGRVVYGAKKADDDEYVLQALDMDTGAPRPEMRLSHNSTFFADDRTLVNHDRDLDVYTDGALSHTLRMGLIVPSLKLRQVKAHGRRLWFVLGPEDTFWAAQNGVLYEVDLQQPAFASPERR